MTKTVKRNQKARINEIFDHCTFCEWFTDLNGKRTVSPHFAKKEYLNTPHAKLIETEPGRYQVAVHDGYFFTLHSFGGLA